MSKPLAYIARIAVMYIPGANRNNGRLDQLGEALRQRKKIHMFVLLRAYRMDT